MCKQNLYIRTTNDFMSDSIPLTIDPISKWMMTKQFLLVEKIFFNFIKSCIVVWSWISKNVIYPMEANIKRNKGIYLLFSFITGNDMNAACLCECAFCDLGQIFHVHCGRSYEACVGMRCGR